MFSPSWQYYVFFFFFPQIEVNFFFCPKQNLNYNCKVHRNMNAAVDNQLKLLVSLFHIMFCTYTQLILCLFTQGLKAEGPYSLLITITWQFDHYLSFAASSISVVRGQMRVCMLQNTVLLTEDWLSVWLKVMWVFLKQLNDSCVFLP